MLKYFICKTKFNACGYFSLLYFATPDFICIFVAYGVPLSFRAKIPLQANVHLFLCYLDE